MTLATVTPLWRGELACSLTRPNPWPLMSLMKAPAVATGALTGSSWVSVIILISQVTQCYDSPPVQAGFFVEWIWQQ